MVELRNNTLSDACLYSELLHSFGSINCWSASCSQVGAGAKGMTGVVGDCEGKPQLGGHQCEAGHGAHQGVHLV